MQINFKELILKNFKSHQDLTVEFGDTTQITGDNAKGKSSIGEAITFLLYGTDLLGSKLDPTPVTYDSDLTMVSLLLDVDGKQVKLGREVIKGRNKYIVNDVPSKATEFNQVVDQLFDKDMFLSLFNPNYYFTMHWEKQREMLLQYVTLPANKEVFEELPKPQAEKLSELVKKHSLDDLNKIHRDNKRKKDKEHIAAQSRTRTLKEQLEEQKPSVPLDSLNAELSILQKEIKQIQESTATARENNKKLDSLQGEIVRLISDRDRMKEKWPELKNEKIEDTCRVCKQPLQDDSLKAAESEKQKRIDEFKTKFNEIIEKRKELEAQIEQNDYVDIDEQMEKLQELQSKINPIEIEKAKYKRFEQLRTSVKQADKTERETLESLNESIFILDSIKDYYAKEAELQAQKVQDLFDNLSIKLFDVVKTTGELKPTFEVMMDGKEYKKLSLSEGIRAGLELRDVLSEQSQIIVPCFVDNAESITKFKEPNGQLIMAKVVAGKELTIESEDK